MRRDLLILGGLVLLIRLPFLGQAVQGDDVYYLLIAQNAQVDPLHPMQMGFRLQGETVWAAGHTRPPGNAYVLAALIALLGGVREIPFHLAYLVFSLVAAISVYWIARRFTRRPLSASLLFATAPVFVVNGNKLEADVPLVALWTLAFALFVYRRFLLSAATFAAAGLFAYQTVFATPILGFWLWKERSRDGRAWLAILAAPLALTAWQLFERAAAGAAPAAVLAGYFQTYDLYAFERKWRSALALLGHLGWIASPLIVFAGWGLRRRRLLWAAGLAGFTLAATLTGYSIAERLFYALSAAAGLAILFAAARDFRSAGREGVSLLAAWIVGFFVAAVAVFYAGSARYLLPLAPAVVVWTARQAVSGKVLAGGIALHLAFGLALAKADYDYSGAYRNFVKRLDRFSAGGRIGTNAEWGLRYYLERIGGEPILAGQRLAAGSQLVTSSLAAAIPYEVEGGRHRILEKEIASGSMPLRMIGKGSRSGYSSTEYGVLPFGLGAGPIDHVVAYKVGGADPTQPYLEMSDPKAETQLLSGFFDAEGAAWRWMGPAGAALLLAPAEGVDQFELRFHIPDGAPTELVEIELDDRVIARKHYETTGSFTLRAPVEVKPGSPVGVRVRVEPPYRPAGDGRELGIVVLGFGFR